ncbi:MAG: TonB family protein [Candidatus Aminicenantaceae bacterium]
MSTPGKVIFSLAFSLMIFSWTIGSWSSEFDAKGTIRYFRQTDTLVAPKVIHQVLPDYPDELRKEGVEGKVKLQVVIDERGNIQNIKIIQPLHPYLDYSAAQAVLQWKFEPVLRKKKPIPVRIVLVIDFNPELQRILEENTETHRSFLPGILPQKDLQRILEQCAVYCKKLTNSALDFICEETITDIHYNFYTEINRSGISIEQQKKVADDLVISVVSRRRRYKWNPFKIEKYRYTCDYQLIKKENKIKQRRFIIKGKDHKGEDRKELFKEKRFSALIPLFAPIRLLETERQTMFHYKIIKEEKIEGNESYVIEVQPKPGGAGGIQYAKLWIDQANFQILKSEIKGFPLKGYEDVFEEAILLKIKPVFTMTTFFHVEKEEVLFPSRSTVLIEYPGLGIRVTSLRYKTEMTYKKYKFFTVEIDHKIIKKISDDFFFQSYENRIILRENIEFFPI